MTNIKYLWCDNSAAVALQKKLARAGKWPDNHEVISGITHRLYNYRIDGEHIDKFGPELTVSLRVNTGNNRYCVQASVFHRHGDEMVKLYQTREQATLTLPTLTKLLTFEFNKGLHAGYGVHMSGSIRDCTIDGAPCEAPHTGCLTFARVNLYMQAMQWLPAIAKELWDLLPDKVNPNK